MTKSKMGARETYSKAICGPGGINCDCCRRGTKKVAKAINARGTRRASRLALAAVVREGAPAE